MSIFKLNFSTELTIHSSKLDNYNTHRRIPPCLIDDGGALFETFFATGDLRNDIVEIRSRRLVLCQKKVFEIWVTFGVGENYN